jgi:nitrate/TMAO reductase-like tetraheme cytochrome c subunit
MTNQNERVGGHAGQEPPSLIYNGVSVAGEVIGVCGIVAALFFLIVGLFSGDPSYGVVMLIPIAAVIVLGGAIVLIGIRRERRRREQGGVPSTLPDWLLDPTWLTRSGGIATVLFSASVFSLGILGIGVASLKTLEYTESNEFCAGACHSVMHPEAEVHATSAHARINCIDCHVGEGADSFIRSKVNGVRQLLAVLSGAISRPIPTPLHNRRPSREMCESCHWAERYIDYKVLLRSYALGDEQNTRRSVRIMVKIGGGSDSSNGFADLGGIHYHMFAAQKVEYITRDPRRQEIPWARVTRADGEVVEYEHLEFPLSESEREELEVHTMECLDCHSRPAHKFQAPINSVNRALASGALPRDLPYIKREAVRALAGEYPTTEDAVAGIEMHLRSFYEKSYPVLNGSRSEDVGESIALIQTIYRDTIFPDMKADWSAHVDNIGHRDSPGCFRCHNYEMESEEGDTIFRSCTTCHVILGQADPESGQLLTEMDFEEGMLFLHPDGDEYLENQNFCSDCHDGGFRLYKKEENEG